jgi:hypothetical protein
MSHPLSLPWKAIELRECIQMLLFAAHEMMTNMHQDWTFFLEWKSVDNTYMESLSECVL